MEQELINYEQKSEQLTNSFKLSAKLLTNQVATIHARIAFKQLTAAAGRKFQFFKKKYWFLDG